MDRCQNASEPETVEGPVDLPAPDDAEFDGTELTTDDGPTMVEDPAAGAATARALDAWADEVRQEHLASALAAIQAEGDLSDDQRAAIAACSRAIVEGILRCPRWRLRADTGFQSAVATLFDLEKD